MDSRQRVLTAMQHQIPDRVPVDLSWGLAPALKARLQRITGSGDPDEYFQLDVRFVSPELSKGWDTIPGKNDEAHLDPDSEAKEAAFRLYLGTQTSELAITEWGVGTGEVQFITSSNLSIPWPQHDRSRPLNASLFRPSMSRGAGNGLMK